MKYLMKIIPIIGLLPYLYIIYEYHSYRATIIFINGIIYHYNNTKLLRYYDIICNLIIAIYTRKEYSNSYKVGYKDQR